MASLRDTIIDSTGAAQLSTGTDAQRPPAVLNGSMRFNTDRGIVEVYNGGYWRDMVNGVGVGSNSAKLLLWVDPALGSKVYGNMITDISGNEYHGTTVNTVSITSDSVGNYIRIGDSAYFSFPQDQLNLTTGQSTVVAITRYNGQGVNARGRIVNGRNNNWLLGHYSSTTTSFYAEGWVSPAPNGPNNTDWGFHAATCDSVADTYAYYKSSGGTAISSSLVASNTNGSQGPNRIGVGAYNTSGTPSEYSNGDVGMIMVFNRVLTVAEIENIRTSYASRFSL